MFSSEFLSVFAPRMTQSTCMAVEFLIVQFQTIRLMDYWEIRNPFNAIIYTYLEWDADDCPAEGNFCVAHIIIKL